MRANDRSAAQVIAMWRAIEMFDPPAIPSVVRGRNRRAGNEYVQEVDLDGVGELPLLPWQSGHPLKGEKPRGRDGAVWRHTVYGGVFRHALISEALAGRFGIPEGEDFAGVRQRGETALFAITVNDDGLIFEDSAAFSTCAWATGRAFAPGPIRPDWLDGFDEVETQCRRAIGMLLHEIITYTDNDDSRADSAHGWRRLVKQILGAAAEGAINSLLQGLTGVIGAVGVGAAVGAVKPIMSRVTKKLSGDSGGDTVGDGDGDGGADEATGPPSRALTVPDLVGFGAHIAALCGVGDMIGPLRLRIRSEPVSPRSDRTFPEPDKPFLNSFLIEDLSRVTSAPDRYGAALRAYMTNPEAVRKKLETKRIDVRRSTDTAVRAVQPWTFPSGRWLSDVDKPLVFGQQLAVNRIVAELMNAGGIFSVNGPPGTGKTTLLRDLIAAIIVARAETMAEFKDPRDAFPARNKITWEFADKRLSVCGPVSELTGFEIVVASSNNAAVENITTALPGLDSIGTDWQEVGSYFAEQASTLIDSPAWGAIAAPLGNSERRRVFRDRFWYDYKSKSRPKSPGIQSLLFDLIDGSPLCDPPAALRFPKDKVRQHSAGDRADATPTDWQVACNRFNNARRSVNTLCHGLDRQARVAGSSGAYLRMSDEERELSAPFADMEWHAARSELFLAAMELHRAFIVNTARTFRQNLHHLIAAMRGVPERPSPEAEAAAWQTLFLMVPVVSTTFSSCGRLFAALGSEMLGWLLVDEAGQASPQAPVGALWRAQRAVLVGDPLQLEPIVKLPAGIQAILQNCYGVPGGWLPASISAQGVADRVNRWGTEVTRRDEDGSPERVWVGAPLRVHRRCEKPMFTVSNEIAYDGLMVYGTQEKRLLDSRRWSRDYHESCWIHVGGGEHDGKWSSREGDALIRRLYTLHRVCGVPLAEICVISPFRDVVRNCQRIVRDQNWEKQPPPGCADYGDQVSRFRGKQIGTVHTMQGRECDAVFLILGAHGPANKKAREWAASTSNLLNVAVSRAKRRLFVIGDHDLWSRLPYFDTLAQHLGDPVLWTPEEQTSAGRG